MKNSGRGGVFKQNNNPVESSLFFVFVTKSIRSLPLYLTDTIMDLLNFPEARRAILEFYQTSGEPQAVQEAIVTSQREQATKPVTIPAASKNKIR